MALQLAWYACDAGRPRPFSRGAFRPFSQLQASDAYTVGAGTGCLVTGNMIKWEGCCVGRKFFQEVGVQFRKSCHLSEWEHMQPSRDSDKQTQSQGRNSLQSHTFLWGQAFFCRHWDSEGTTSILGNQRVRASADATDAVSVYKTQTLNNYRKPGSAGILAFSVM